LGGSIPSKSRENCGEVRDLKHFGQASPSRSREIAEKSAFQEFFGSPKNRGKLQNNPNFETCSLWENRKEFLDEPVLQNPETPWKNPRFEIFVGPLKIVGKGGKTEISKPVHCGKKQKFKCRNLFLIPCQKNPNWQTLTSSPHFSSHLPPNYKRCSKPEAYCLLPLSGLSTKNEQELGLVLE
jgi:hypothetical protein